MRSNATSTVKQGANGEHRPVDRPDCAGLLLSVGRGVQGFQGRHARRSLPRAVAHRLARARRDRDRGRRLARPSGQGEARGDGGRALTGPAQRREWAPFDADASLGRVGSKVKLTTVGAPGPHITETTVTRAEAPRVLEYNWGGFDMRWQLEEIGRA